MKRLFAFGALLFFCWIFQPKARNSKDRAIKWWKSAGRIRQFPSESQRHSSDGKSGAPSFRACLADSFCLSQSPLPIGHGQTISQPLIVALMTELLKVKEGDKVLEIGTGSGYQAAVLAEIAKSVYTIEIIEPLGKQAAERLQSLGYDNVKTKVGDGYYGWPEAAPFDAIMVTAAASHVPPPLLKQLKPGGRMVIPLGTHFMTQYLMLVEKQAGRFDDHPSNRAGRFVPLTGGH